MPERIGRQREQAALFSSGEFIVFTIRLQLEQLAERYMLPCPPSEDPTKPGIFLLLIFGRQA
jgi:hypothetical protein